MRSARKLRRTTLIVCIAIFIAWLASTEAAWQLAGGFLVMEDQPRKTDLIVVLGGDFWGPRVDKAAQLGVEGFAPKVLIDGPPYGAPPRPESELAIERLVERGFRKELFESFPIKPGSTPDECVQLCRELRRRGVREILLVTDAYHSRRAYVTFRGICPLVRAWSVPARDHHYEPLEWWKRPKDQAIAKSEWKKLLGTILLTPWYWFQ